MNTLVPDKERWAHGADAGRIAGMHPESLLRRHREGRFDPDDVLKVGTAYWFSIPALRRLRGTRDDVGVGR